MRSICSLGAAYEAFVGAARGRALVSPLLAGDRPDTRVLGSEAFVRELPMPVPRTASTMTLDQLITAARSAQVAE